MKNRSLLLIIHSVRWQLFWAISSCLIVTTHWSGIYYQYDSIKWWLLDVFLATYVIINVLSCDQINLSKLGALVLIFLGWGLISTLWACHHYAALETSARYILLAASIYFLSRQLTSQSAEIFLLTVAISSCSCFFIVLATERYLLGQPYQAANYTPLGFINHAGHVYIFWIPVLFWGAIKFHKYYSTLCAIFLIATLSLLADSAIRASIVGLGVACIILGAAYFKTDKSITFKTIGMLSLLAIALVTVSSYQSNDSTINSKLTRVVNAPNLNYASSDRILMYKNTVRMILDNPFGVGLNNFEYIHPLYGQAGTPNASPFMNEAEILKQPHNYYLKAISELGWLGGLAVFCLIFGLIKPAFHLKEDKGSWGYLCLLILVATFLNALFCAVFSNPASLWFFLLVTASYLAITKFSISTVTIDITQIGRITLVGVAFTFIGFSCASLSSQVIANEGFKTQDTVRIRRATEIYPGNERAWFDLAIALYEQDNNPSEAIIVMRRFLSFYPYHIGGRFKITQWYCFQREFARCRAEALHLLSYYPSFKPAQQFYQQAGESIRRSQ
jgi:O-antigen ligase